jgi:TetR/AcrR family transcriptional regulator, cholesterol catabolism regulator
MAKDHRRTQVSRRGAGPPRQLDLATAPRIRRDIVRAASTVFSARGYHAASMEDVARAAGMQKGSLYHHVGKKEDLLFAIHSQMVNELTALTLPVVASSRTPAEKIREIVTIAMEFIARHREGTHVFLQEWGAVTGPRWETLVAKRDLFESLVVGVIQDGIATGEFAPTRADIAARGLLGMVNWCYTWFRTDGDLTAREVADTFAALALGGLGAPGRSDDLVPKRAL